MSCYKNMLNKAVVKRIVLFLVVSLSIVTTSLPLAIAKKKGETSEKTPSSDTTKEKKEPSEGAPLFPEYKGPKKRIAVMDFEDKTGRAEGRVGEGMTEMLITALHETGRFIVVERKAITDVLTEQDFGETGRVSKETAAKLGNILGAQVLVRGAVTEFEASKKGGLGGVHVGGITLGGGGSVAHVAVDIRMYDANTGVVLESHRSVGEAKTSALALGGVVKGIGIGGAGFTKTPLGQATRTAIVDMVKFVVQKMEDRPWQARVIQVSNNTVYINAGENSGVSVGDTLSVYSVGEELIDPETGLSLGAEKTKCGLIQISSMEPKFSKAIVVSGGGFKRNDIVETK